MSGEPNTLEVVRDEVSSAIAEVRAVARSEHDEQRNRTADWLDEQFVDVTDGRGLREAAANALNLYGGGRVLLRRRDRRVSSRGHPAGGCPAACPLLVPT